MLMTRMKTRKLFCNYYTGLLFFYSRLYVQLIMDLLTSHYSLIHLYELVHDGNQLVQVYLHICVM